MSSLGFLYAAARPLFTISASKISVERVTERAANLSWSGPSNAPYTVLYAPVGAPFRSRRAVAHPSVSLNGLKQGTSYKVEVIGTGSSQFTTFQTVATAGSPASADVEDVPEAPLTELSRLEMRVGKIIECERHPDADTLFVEKVDVGEGEPRTIVSGLVGFVPLEEMIGRSVVVLCNLKPRTMRGVTSYGMLMCASNEDHSKVDPLAAPEAAPIGELITFEGHRVAPIDPGNRATKAFDRIAAGLKTNEEGVAFFEDSPFATSAGPCSSPAKLVGTVS